MSEMPRWTFIIARVSPAWIITIHRHPEGSPALAGESEGSCVCLSVVLIQRMAVVYCVASELAASICTS